MAGGIVQGQISEDVELGGGGTQISKNQATHGFNLYEPIYHNGSTWELAQADDGATLAEYLVTEVEDVDNFVATKFGEVEATGHGFTVGEHYFLDDTVAGGAVTTEPNTYSCPLFYVEDANTLHVEIYRPSVPQATATPIQWEKKLLTVNTGGTAIIPALSFSGLIPGKDYKVTGNIQLTEGGDSNGAFAGLYSNNGSEEVINTYIYSVPNPSGNPNGDTVRKHGGVSGVFTAQGTTLDTYAQCGISGVILANSYLVLEEMPTKQVFIDVPGVTKWQKKEHSSGNFTGSGELTDLRFNNLVLGKTYRVRYRLRALGNNNVTINIWSGTFSCGSFSESWACSLYTQSFGYANVWNFTSEPFIADATTLIFNVSENDANTSNNSGTNFIQNGTYAVLEELPTHIETTEWS